MQTYLVYMRNPRQYVTERRWREFFSLQLIVGSNVAASLSGHFLLPIFLAFSILLRLTLGYRYFLLAGVICAASLLVIAALTVILACMGCVKRRQYDLLKWMALYPLYMFLLGTASLIAVYQLIVKPHYWEKTTHEGALQRASEPRLRAWD
ncbi:MAG TPA: hypothetical protein VE715_09605 [Blastocatellia bacterium]|nr:hypothetical protein [Blastocatellia bacterium]